MKNLWYEISVASLWFQMYNYFYFVWEQWSNWPSYILKCPVVKFDKSLYLYLINSFKLPVQVYFMLGTHQIVTPVLLSLHRTDISLYIGENW